MSVDRNRLAQVLGMLGSAHDGEALNAARLASKMIRDAGLTWFDVLSVQSREIKTAGTAPLSDREAVDTAWESGDLTNWEMDFVASLKAWLSKGRTLTSKQRSVLYRIIDE
jgi:hypothetical protein